MKHQNEIQAGLFITLGIALFIVFIWALGQRRQIFERQERYTTSFLDVQGLSEGAPVRLGGISIGRVASIGFSKDHNDPKIYVEFLINNRYLERIRGDSLVSIETQGLLGDKFLNVKYGGAGPMVEPGGAINSKEPADISAVLTKAGEVVDNTVEISQSLNELITTVKQTTVDHFSRGAEDLADILKQVKTGKGMLHQLVYTNEDSKMMKNLEKAAGDLADITGQVKKGDGLLNAIIFDPEGQKTVEALTEASKNLAVTAADISELAGQIKSGDGLVHSLIYDKSPEGIDDIVAKLNRTASNLEKASKSLASGEGTLGALLVDAQLYNNAVEITDGAKRSFLLKEAVRSTLD